LRVLTENQMCHWTALGTLLLERKRKENNMAPNNQSFWTEDIIAAAILAATGGTALLLNKLDDLALSLNFPVLHELVQWWPALLILAGLILLLANQSSESGARKPVQPVSQVARGEDQ
jgi:hypothetical protein